MNAYLIGASGNKEKLIKELIAESQNNQKETVALLLKRHEFDLTMPKLSKQIKDITAFVYHPTDDYAAMSYYNKNTIHISNLETEQELVQLQGHKDIIWALAFNGDGTQLASGDEEGAVYLWDVRVWQVVAQLEIPQKKYCSSDVHRLLYNPKQIAQLLVLQSLDRITMWDTERRQQIGKKKGYCVAFNAAGTECAIGHKNKVELYDSTTWDLLKTIDFYRDLSSIAYHPKDDRLTVGCCSDYIAIQRNAEFKRIGLPGGGAWPLIAYSPEGDRLIIAREKHIHICNIADEQKVWFVDDDMSVTESIAYHPTKKQFAILSQEAHHIWRKEPMRHSTLRILDIPDYKEIIAPLNLAQALYIDRELTRKRKICKERDEESQEMNDSLPDNIKRVLKY